MEGARLQTGHTAAEFLEQYGSLFGLANPQKELVVKKTSLSENNHAHIRYQQVYQGIPILGGELTVSENQAGSITAASGEILPAIELPLEPRISAGEAAAIAISQAAEAYDLDPLILSASSPELWVYNPALLGAPGLHRATLVWRVEVTPAELLPVRELVLVDAQLGVVSLSFNQADPVLYREVHDQQNSRKGGLPGGLVRRENGPSTGLQDADNAYLFSGDTYDFYARYHQRSSIDGRGMPLVSTVRYCHPYLYECPFPNAFWNGQQMVYGQGYASADDVVAHELTHGVTENTSGLFYYMQSGAINEAFSDIWGEFVDLTNGRGNDSPQVRWLIGEDLPGGAIRSMKNPPSYGDPDKMSSPLYACSLSDNGGVHSNSGIANKAAFLMTDGGSFNGYTVRGLGIEKTARIWYEAQANLLTSAADYNDLYEGLQTACSILRQPEPAPQPVPGPLTLLPHRLYLPLAARESGTSQITGADCQEVKKALDAVEMYARPRPTCFTTPAAMCTPGSQPVFLFSDNLENPEQAGWKVEAISGTDHWYYPQPDHFTYATSGRHNLWGYNHSARGDSAIGMARSVFLPAGSLPFLYFKHAYTFQQGKEFNDGGVVEYRLDGAPTWYDAGVHFPSETGYREQISGKFNNPLANRLAFVGKSYGYTGTRINLEAIAGRAVSFRFRMGTDSQGGGLNDYGWFIDDIQVYTCSANNQP
jgi:bacillolysin